LPMDGIPCDELDLQNQPLRLAAVTRRFSTPGSRIVLLPVNAVKP
jgi:hypothetical protein